MSEWLQWTLYALEVAAAVVAIYVINRAQKRRRKYDASDDNDRGMR